MPAPDLVIEPKPLMALLMAKLSVVWSARTVNSPLPVRVPPVMVLIWRMLSTTTWQGLQKVANVDGWLFQARLFEEKKLPFAAHWAYRQALLIDPENPIAKAKTTRRSNP